MGILGSQGRCFGAVTRRDAHGVASGAELFDKAGAHVACTNNENFHTISFRGVEEPNRNRLVVFKAWGELYLFLLIR
jgi:hypothetical protein